MFYAPSDVMADQCFDASTNNEHASLNLTQMDHSNSTPPSPGNSPSSSPASLSCSTISSLKAWRGASEQLQTPIFSFPDPVYRNFSAITANASDEPSGQRTSCAQMSVFETHSSQEPTIPIVDGGELEELRRTTGVPCHMMDVFRANPFTVTDPQRTTRTTPPSLGNSTNPDRAECMTEGLHRARSATKHILSPDAVEQRRKCRTKRARIQSPPVVPFPATGPQEMFAYEFRLDFPYGTTGISRVEDYRRYEDLPPSYSLSRAMDARGHLLVSRPVEAYSSEDTFMRLPVDHEDREPSFLPPIPYPCPDTASILQKARSEHRMQPSYYPFLPSVSLSTQMSLRLGGPSNSAASASPTRFEEHRCCSLPAAMPMQAMPETAQTCRPSAAPAASSTQKPLYACPLCPRDFQLPNGLALHLKWHGRVGNSIKNPTPHLDHRPHDRVMLKVSRTESGPLDVRDVRLTQLPTQDNSRRGAFARLPSTSYLVPHGANSTHAESVSESLV